MLQQGSDKRRTRQNTCNRCSGSNHNAPRTKAAPQQYPQDQDGAAIESQQNPELDPEENFKKAVDMVHGRQQVPENILNSISSNPELAARLAYVYELKQLQLPKALQKYARHPRAIGG